MTEVYVRDVRPKSDKPHREMSIGEFVKDAGGDEVNELFSRVTGGSYMGCHCIFYEKTGIWIPELVPLFQKMDAMMVLRGPVAPDR